MGTGSSMMCVVNLLLASSVPGGLVLLQWWETLGFLTLTPSVSKFAYGEIHLDLLIFCRLQHRVQIKVVFFLY